MENETAIKILRMRAAYCGWDAVIERFGHLYKSRPRVREALHRWAKAKKVDIQWAFPHGEAWDIVAPDNWQKELEDKLSVNRKRNTV